MLKAVDGNVRLVITQDECAESPREWSNLGTMVCWHRRYNLGDDHNHESPSELFEALALEIGIPWEKLENLDFEGLQEIVEASGEYIILPLYLYDHSGITMSTSAFSCPWDSGRVGYLHCSRWKFLHETGYTEAELFSKDAHRVPALKEHVEVRGLEEKGWGQVTELRDDGIVVVDFDYNKVLSFRKPENVVEVPLSEIVKVMAERAQEMLEAEVDIYDDYLRGNVYGFELEKRDACECCGRGDWEHIDSCSGFYGTDWHNNGLAEYVPSEYRYLVDRLEWEA